MLTSYGVFLIVGSLGSDLVCLCDLIDSSTFSVSFDIKVVVIFSEIAFLLMKP